MAYANLTQPTSQTIVDAAALNKLKEKVICEFRTLLTKTRKGYKLDYEFILEEISFINLIKDNEIDDKLSLITLQYYLNNKWQTQS
ncbi:MAG: hypothetical protein K2G70_01975 [Turicibacter sp.]|nr:hypothetical protein [Turicibacter sp.]